MTRESASDHGAGGGDEEQHDFGYRTDFYTFAPETLAQELSAFDIVREVGKGSMGIVYEATRKVDGHRVALKVLPPSLTLTDRALARFVKEGEVMARIEHPSIVRVFEHGHRGRLHYFAMEFVRGTTLEQRVRIGPLPARDAAEACVQVADALQFAHDRGVVHRDIKPGNLILTDEGKVMITDFGLARETGTGSFTESGAIVGTPMYMAPEQILGHRSDVDSRADVYGLGATLFELLTGRPPFVAPTAQGVLQAVLEQEPPRPGRFRGDLPQPLEAITLRALAKSPADRYGSARDLADDLRRFLNGERVLARMPTLATRTKRAAQRHPWIAALSVVALALAVGAAALVIDRTQQQQTERLDQAELKFTRATTRREAGFRRLQPKEKLQLLQQARALASQAITDDPRIVRAWIVRGRIHRELREWERALYDFDHAEMLLDAPREDLLRYRIGILDNLPPTAEVTMRLMGDLKSLLALDRSTETLCLVIDYLLRFAAATPDAGRREAILSRVSTMLQQIQEPTGPAAIAEAQLLHLRGRDAEAIAAAENACMEFPGDALVHEEAARIYRALHLTEDAEAEESMAKLLRGDAHDAPQAGDRSADPTLRPIDTKSLRSWLRDLGQLFGDGRSKQP